MLWIVGSAAAAALIAFVAYLLFLRPPVRQAMALTRASQRACLSKDWEGALRYCRLAHQTASLLKDPLKSCVVAGIEIQWATVLYRQGRMREAEGLLKQGFATARSVGHYQPMMPAHLVWGDLCVDEGRHQDAEFHYRTALEGEQKVGNLAMMVFNLQRLGDSLIRQERREEAEEVINQAITLETRVVHEQMVRDGKNPAEHPVIAWSLPDLYFCRRQYDDARRLYREKVNHWEKCVTRPDNIDLGRLQIRLAVSEALTGNRAEAVEYFTRAESTYTREWGESHPKVAAARNARAECLAEAANSSPA